MGFLDFFKKDKSKTQFHTKPFRPVVVPYITPNPTSDPRNARKESTFDIFKSSSTAWAHTYGKYTAAEIRLLYDIEPMARAIVNKARNEIVRRGDEWKERYAGMCPSCKKEYPTLPELEEVDEINPEDPDYLCEECGNTLVLPDPKEYQEAQKVFEHPWPGQPHISWEDLVSMRWRDIFQLGNGYVIAQIIYPQVNQKIGKLEKGDIVDMPEADELKRKVIGFFYASEPYCRKVMDAFGNLGGKYFVCLACRGQEDYEPETELKNCKCGRRTYPAELIVSTTYADVGRGNKYYIKGEWHWTPFDPDSVFYSYPPGATLGCTLETMIFQGINFLNLYKNESTPPFVKWAKVDSVDAFEEWMDHMAVKYQEGDLPWMAMQSDASGPPVGVEKMTYTPKEMDSMEYRERLENIVATFYGITPSERGSKESGSGLGNESKDITIGNKNIMTWMDKDNEGLYQWAVDLFGIKMWRRLHVPPEPEDDSRQAQRDGMFLDAVAKALDVGLTAKRREGTEQLEIYYEGQPDSPEKHRENNSFNVNPFGDDNFDEGGEGEEELMEEDDPNADRGGPIGEGSP